MNPAPASLFACLYVREFPAQALLRLRPELREKPFAVLAGEPPLQTICSINSAARLAGVSQGMTLVEMESLAPVTAMPRSQAEEQATRTALLECVAFFSPRVEDCGNDQDFVCVVDIAGTELLFGSPQKLAQRLLRSIRALGITATVSVSYDFNTSVCHARGMHRRTGVVVIEKGQEAAALAKLPLSVLNLSAEQHERFALWGIHSVGMLAELPEKALVARIGQEGRRLQQIAHGGLPHLFMPVEAAFALEEYMELEVPVELLDSLLFGIGRMLQQLIVRAAARVYALASITVKLRLDGAEDFIRMIRPALPTNDKKLWLKLLHLDLQAHPPIAAVLAITLQAEPGSTSKVQMGLFSPQLPEASRLDVTLARIRSMVGDKNAGWAVLKDTHGRESFAVEPFSVTAKASSTTQENSQPRACMRRLRPAEKIHITLVERRPAAFIFREKRFLVQHAYGPWLASGEWWRPTLWAEVQWDAIAQAHDGTILSCCLLHDEDLAIAGR